MSDVIVRTEIKNLDILPSGPVPKNPADILESLQDNIAKIDDDRIPPSEKIISIINSIRKRLDEIEKLVLKTKK